MKSPKKRICSGLVFAAALLGTVTIPSTAQDKNVGVHDYYTTYVQRCSCTTDADFEINFESFISADGSKAVALSSVSHKKSNCETLSVNHSATIWYSQGATASAYSTFTDPGIVYANTSSNDPSKIKTSFSARQAVGDQKFFCIETSHSVMTVCNPHPEYYEATTKAQLQAME